MQEQPVAVTPAVQLDTVAAGYGGTKVLDDLSWTVGSGELVGVVGPSGCGKTTLLRLLTGQADRHTGTVRVLDRDVRPGRPPPRVGYVPQLDAIDWDFPLRVEQAVLLGLAADTRRRPWFTAGERAQARALLERLGIGGLGGRSIRELSVGQRQRMFLARAMIRRCELILLDEPTSGVDLATRHEILHLLADLNAEGLTIVLTTHDLNWVATHLPRVACLNGAILADGPPERVLTVDVLRRTYGAEMRVIRDGDLLVVADGAPLLPEPAVQAGLPLHR